MSEKVLNISTSIKSTQSDIKVNYLDLFLQPSLRTLNFISCCCWLMISITLYGMKQFIGQYSDNAFISVAINGGVQIPGQIGAVIMNKIWGRKVTFISSSIVCGVSTITMIFVKDNFWLHAAIGALVIGTGDVVFCTLYMLSGELFPTVIRNMAVGASSTSGRLGSVIAPIIIGLTSTADWLPPLLFGVMPLFAAFLCFFLPETKGKPLQDKI